MMIRLPILLSLAMALFGCAAEIDAATEEDFVEDLLTLPADEGKDDGNRRVRDYVSRGCTTAPVLGLATQIAERMACMAPDQLGRFEASADIEFNGSAILPYLHPAAISALSLAAQSVGTIGVTSAFRTLPQQYLLYQWWAGRRCSISSAASPGRSNHETGRALDLSNYSALRRRLGEFGWIANVPGDVVHFEEVRATDGRRLDTMAFQELWNLNNPGDPIDTDGEFGPETERRVRNSPARGFARSGCE